MYCTLVHTGTCDVSFHPVVWPSDFVATVACQRVEPQLTIIPSLDGGFCAAYGIWIYPPETMVLSKITHQLQVFWEMILKLWLLYMEHLTHVQHHIIVCYPEYFYLFLWLLKANSGSMRKQDATGNAWTSPFLIWTWWKTAGGGHLQKHAT